MNEAVPINCSLQVVVQRLYIIMYSDHLSVCLGKRKRPRVDMWIFRYVKITVFLVQWNLFNHQHQRDLGQLLLNTQKQPVDNSAANHTSIYKSRLLPTDRYAHLPDTHKPVPCVGVYHHFSGGHHSPHVKAQLLGLMNIQILSLWLNYRLALS